jgi:hypothetical protein
VNALEQLDRVRRDAVERAKRAHVEVKHTVQQRESALQTALQREQQAERLLASARADYARATTILDLRAAELQLVHARKVRSEAHAVRLRCDQAHAVARAALSEQERLLLEAELGRRAVERRLTQQVADVGRRTERRREDEAEDTFRATRTR